MLHDIKDRLQVAARRSDDADAPDLSYLWRRGRVRRHRWRLVAASSVLGLAAAATIAFTQLLAPTVVPPFISDGSTVPEQASVAPHPDGGPVAVPNNDVFEVGGALHCSGFHALGPRDLVRQLEALGYEPEWRHADGSNTPVPLEDVPADAVVTSTHLDSDGIIYLFSVEPDMPDAAEAERYGDGCR